MNSFGKYFIHKYYDKVTQRIDNLQADMAFLSRIKFKCCNVIRWIRKSIE